MLVAGSPSFGTLLERSHSERSDKFACCWLRSPGWDVMTKTKTGVGLRLLLMVVLLLLLLLCRPALALIDGNDQDVVNTSYFGNIVPDENAPVTEVGRRLRTIMIDKCEDKQDDECIKLQPGNFTAYLEEWDDHWPDDWFYLVQGGWGCFLRLFDTPDEINFYLYF